MWIQCRAAEGTLRITGHTTHVTHHTNLRLSHAGKMRRFAPITRACKRPPRVQTAHNHQVYQYGRRRQRCLQLLHIKCRRRPHAPPALRIRKSSLCNHADVACTSSRQSLTPCMRRALPCNCSTLEGSGRVADDAVVDVPAQNVNIMTVVI